MTVTFIVYSLLGLAVLVYLYLLYRIAAPLPREVKQKWWIMGAGLVFFLLFAGTGVLVLYLDLFPERELAQTLQRLTKLLFGIHLFFWMLLGMAANYLWELFKTDKKWSDIRLTQLLLPFFVSPLVFYSIWVLASKEQVAFVLVLVAFQNGFFWQVVLARAGPVVQQLAASQSAEKTKPGGIRGLEDAAPSKPVRKKPRKKAPPKKRKKRKKK
jgi:hypothetical protein